LPDWAGVDLREAGGRVCRPGGDCNSSSTNRGNVDHEVLVKHLFPARAEVISAGEFVEVLGTR
jgi:hypothetical protein